MEPVQTGLFRRLAVLALVLGTLCLVARPAARQILQHARSSMTTRLVSPSALVPDPNAGERVSTSLTQSFAKGVTAKETAVRHYEYVFPDGSIYVYELDGTFELVKRISVPTSAGVRGCVASAATGTLYLSYGSIRNAGGSMLAYELRHDRLLWQRHYPFGIDSMSITADARTIYMPTGELTSSGVWEVLDAATGLVTGSIDTKSEGPHNSILNTDGSRVYLGPRFSNYLLAADTRDNTVTKEIGPVESGVRPFTINGEDTLAFITTSGLLGFEVGDIDTGKVIYTIRVRGFPASGGPASAPSHGISLSPDEREIYLIDSINSYVHVFDVSGLPASAPRQVADIKLVGALSGEESGCAYDCLKDGWIHHSRTADLFLSVIREM